MADYYPLLTRALDALPDRSPALRKAVYDRARTALIGQLRSLEPPLPAADIDVEAQALEAAIARLEETYGTPAPAARSAAPPPRPAPAAAPSAPPPPPPQAPAPAPVRPQPAPERQREVSPPPFRAPAPPPPPPEPVTVPVTPEPERPEPLPEPGPSAATPPFVPRRRAPKAEPAPAPVAAREEPASDFDAQAGDALAAPAEPVNGRQRPRIAVKKPGAKRTRLMRNVFLGTVLVAVIGLIAVAAFLLRDQPSELPPEADAPNAQKSAPEAKFNDRVGGGPGDPAPPGPSSGADVTVAQRAVFYEENTDDPKAPPPSTSGRVTWRLDSVSGDQGQPLQSAVRATVEFPNGALSLVVTIRKNLEPTLPASHTIDLVFASPEGGDRRIVQEIGLIQTKDDEASRGAPVSGLPVRVGDNIFLIGLSNLPADIERNKDLLLHRNWFEVVLKFKSGKRAIITFEKGGAGARVLQDAFDQWK